MNTDQALSRQHAVVTGAGRGIGAAISEELARLGADVTLMGRVQADLDRRRIKLETNYTGTFATLLVDVAEADSVIRGFELAAGHSGPAAILVNNAGIAESGPFLKIDLQHWNRILAVDLLGAVLCTQQVLPSMIEAGYGRIVNIASTAGLKGYAYVSAYTAAKHALVGLTRALALEMARTSVTVNAVCPGYTETDLLEATIDNIVATTGRSFEEARGELAAVNPQRRLIQPEEVASVVGWLCLPESGSITGQSIAVAGGEVM